MLIDADWYTDWKVTYADLCWLVLTEILIDMLIDATLYWLMLIDTDWCSLIIVDTNW